MRRRGRTSRGDVGARPRSRRRRSVRAAPGLVRWTGWRCVDATTDAARRMSDAPTPNADIVGARAVRPPPANPSAQNLCVTACIARPTESTNTAAGARVSGDAMFRRIFGSSKAEKPNRRGSETRGWTGTGRGGCPAGPETVDTGSEDDFDDGDATAEPCADACAPELRALFDSTSYRIVAFMRAGSQPSPRRSRPVPRCAPPKPLAVVTSEPRPTPRPSDAPTDASPPLPSRAQPSRPRAADHRRHRIRAQRQDGRRPSRRGSSARLVASIASHPWNVDVALGAFADATKRSSLRSRARSSLGRHPLYQEGWRRGGRGQEGKGGGPEERGASAGPAARAGAAASNIRRLVRRGGAARDAQGRLRRGVVRDASASRSRRFVFPGRRPAAGVARVRFDLRAHHP